MRGKLGKEINVKDVIRITPAGAGKTFAPSVKFSKVTDHPRRCGENPMPTRGNHPRSGSPPQVRGKHITNMVNPSA